MQLNPSESVHSSEPIPLVETHLDASRSLLTGQVTVMDRNDRIRHDKLCAGIIECLKPADALEIQLAQSIAEDYWRLNRCRGIEEGIFSICHPDPSGDVGAVTMEHEIALSQTRAFLWKQADFKFLSQYETRIQRALDRNKAELKQLQAERRRQPAEGPRKNDGFVFSNQPAGPESDLEHPQTHTATANGFGFSNSTPQPQTAAPSITNGFVFSSSLPPTEVPLPEGVTRVDAGKLRLLS